MVWGGCFLMFLVVLMFMYMFVYVYDMVVFRSLYMYTLLMICFYIVFVYLVGGFKSYEKIVNWDLSLFPIYGEINNVPNHQPDMLGLESCLWR